MVAGGLESQAHPCGLVDVLLEYFIDRVFAEVVCQDAFLGPEAVDFIRQNVELLLLGVLAIFLEHVIGRETLLLDLSEGFDDIFLFSKQIVDSLLHKEHLRPQALILHSELDVLLLDRSVMRGCNLDVALGVNVDVSHAFLAEASRVSGVLQPLALLDIVRICGDGHLFVPSQVGLVVVGTS